MLTLYSSSIPQRAWYRSDRSATRAAAVEQGGAEDVLGPAVGVLDEAQRDGLPGAAGLLAGQVPQGLGAGQDRHDGVGLVAGDEAV